MTCRELVLLILIFGHASTVWAAVYVVDTVGHDSNSGGPQAPWRTLQHAADQVAPGDTVMVREGDYAGFFMTASGTAENPICFQADAGSVIVSRNARTPDGINLEGSSHVVIDGFEIVGMPRAGVRTVGPFVDSQQEFSEGVVIRNVVARDNQVWGILTGFVNTLIIEGNTTSGSVAEHGIYVGNSGDNPVIRGNRIFGNNASGIQINADRHAGRDGVIENALISGNIIYDNGVAGGSAINLDGVRDSRVENNLLYGNHASGIALYQIDGALPSTGNTVVNNTVLQASDGRWALSLQNGATDATLANNILLNDHDFRGAIDISTDSLTRLTSNNNAVVPRFTMDGGNSVLSLNDWRQLTSQDASSVSATASELFVDSENNDYHLNLGSFAREAGWNFPAPAFDLEGIERPQGERVDIGAYEWQAAGGDYNLDGTVDQADYLLWQDRYGVASTTPIDAADGNSDGRVDAADYTIWRDQFFEAGTADVTPEPTQGWPMILALCCTHASIRREKAIRALL